MKKKVASIFKYRLVILFSVFSTSVFSMEGPQDQGAKIMSSRCILHGMDRALCSGDYSSYFGGNYTNMVHESIAQVEKAAENYTRPIDQKLSKIFKMPRVLQTLLFNIKALAGYDSYVLTRKIMIRQLIEKALETGITQFVFLGSGLDPAALDLSISNPNATFFTVDLPEAQKIMLNVAKSFVDESKIEVNRVHFRVNSNFTSMSIDLDDSTQEVFDLLEKRGLSKDSRVFVLMEGLTVYLEKNTLERILENFKNKFPPDSELLLSFTQVDKVSQKNSAQAQAHQEANERYKFVLPIREVENYIDSLGLMVLRRFTSDYFIGLNEGSYFFNYLYWYKQGESEDGVDYSTPEPYFLLIN